MIGVEGRAEKPLDAGFRLPARVPILIAVSLWGFQIPVIHALGSRWDMTTQNIARYFVAFLALWLLARVWRRGPVAGPGLVRSLAIGAMFASFGMIYTLASIIGDPIALVAVLALAPLSSSLVNWAMLGVPPHRALILALVLVIPGAILATPVPEDAAPGSHPVLAVIMVLCAQALWSVYSLSIQRWMPAASPFGRTRYSVMWSLPFHLMAFALAAAMGWLRFGWDISPVSDGALMAAVAIGPLVIGVLCWNESVNRIGLPLSALHLNLLPVIGIGIAMLFGIWPEMRQLGGVALVLSGTLMAQLRGGVPIRGRPM